MDWYLQVWKKYAVFTGRARRKEYWMFALFNLIITLILAVIDGLTGSSPLAGLYMLAIVLPALAVGVRRLHDTGRSGWWLLVAFVPIIGSIVLLFLMVQDSHPGENQYGPNPKAAVAA